MGRRFGGRLVLRARRRQAVEPRRRSRPRAPAATSRAAPCRPPLPPAGHAPRRRRRPRPRPRTPAPPRPPARPQPSARRSSAPSTANRSCPTPLGGYAGRSPGRGVGPPRAPQPCASWLWLPGRRTALGPPVSCSLGFPECGTGARPSPRAAAAGFLAWPRLRAAATGGEPGIVMSGTSDTARRAHADPNGADQVDPARIGWGIAERAPSRPAGDGGDRRRDHARAGVTRPAACPTRRARHPPASRGRARDRRALRRAEPYDSRHRPAGHLRLINAPERSPACRRDGAGLDLAQRGRARIAVAPASATRKVRRIAGAIRLHRRGRAQSTRAGQAGGRTGRRRRAAALSRAAISTSPPGRPSSAWPPTDRVPRTPPASGRPAAHHH